MEASFAPLGGAPSRRALPATGGNAGEAAARPPHQHGAPQYAAPLWQPPVHPVGYAVTTAWVEHANRETARTVLAREVTATFGSTRPGLPSVTLETAASRWLSPNPPPLAGLMQRLSGLYRKLVLHVGPTGQPLAVLNGEALQAVWAELRRELALPDQTDAPDALTAGLLAATDAQLARPDAVLAALRHDYFYPLFFADLAGRRYATDTLYRRPRRLAQFFAGLDLWFAETLELLPAASGAPHLTLRGRGAADAARTPPDRLAAAVQARLGLGEAPAADPAGLRLAYEATYEIEKSTGLLVAVEATVLCRYAAHYRKEYHLTVIRQPLNL